MKDYIGGAYLLVYDDIEVTYNPRRLAVAPSHDIAGHELPLYVVLRLVPLVDRYSDIRTLLH